MKPTEASIHSAAPHSQIHSTKPGFYSLAMKYFQTLTVLLLIMSNFANSDPIKILNLNVFDQLQGSWEPGFRENRMNALSDWIKLNVPDLVVFQEAKALSCVSFDSVDAENLKSIYPFRKYVHEMIGNDNASYGYWMGAKKQPTQEWSDGFSFPGGVARKTQAAVWSSIAGEPQKCLGILSLHLSYQSSLVRQQEAAWILEWLRAHESVCKHWLVVGDFNADREDKEIQILIEGGLKSLYKNKKPTVGAFNPIRQIYGKDIPSRTIDWAFGWHLEGMAKVIFDQPIEEGTWVSDHAGIEINL